MGTYNDYHVNRHESAQDISLADSVGTYYNPNTQRQADIVYTKGNKTFVYVSDNKGDCVTKFERNKVCHNGVQGTKEYLQRNGYKENKGCFPILLIPILFTITSIIVLVKG